jgi:hypothetical protein
MAIYNILWQIGTLDRRLVYFVVIWYILSALVHCAKKNLATL